jgi:hypothetical protein
MDKLYALVYLLILEAHLIADLNVLLAQNVLLIKRVLIKNVLILVPALVVQMPDVMLKTTPQYVLATLVTQVIHLVDAIVFHHLCHHNKMCKYTETHAYQILVGFTQLAELLENHTLVRVYQIILEPHLIVDLNVSFIPSAQVIWLVLEKNVEIHVLVAVATSQTVTFRIIFQPALVLKVMKEIRLIHVILRNLHLPLLLMILAIQALVVQMLIV